MSDGWQERHAAVLDHEVAELEKLLAELENGEAIAEAHGNTSLCSELRATASAVRAFNSGLRGHARQLRASTASEQPLPMIVTRRVG